MAVTRSTAAERAQRTEPAELRTFRWRTEEFVLLALSSFLIVAGMFLTYQAHQARLPQPARTPLNLTQVDRREALLPYLGEVAAPTERLFVAEKIADALRDRGSDLSNVGVLGRIRVPVREVMHTRGLPALQQRARQLTAAAPNVETMPLLTAQQVSAIKPFLVVRQRSSFRDALLLWGAVFFIVFFAVHLFWTARGFDGPSYVLPALLLLSGAGVILMIALRDPVRDTLLFRDFIQGAALGCVALAACSMVDYQRVFGRLAYAPLLGSFVLSVALIVFGTGPGTSDARVNLLGFQPTEIIRVLIVLFLAGYFANRWEFLRTLRERRPELEKVSRWVEVPRLEYLLPVIAGVVISLAFFFLQKDLGPALIIACLFLAMYAVARDRYLFATAGLLVIIGGFAAGYLVNFPRNVAGRVTMWLSPWDNAVHGGEQVVDALWGFATGGFTGTGLGLGDPAIMPAAHTDLILAALGEEWGFIGFLCVFALYTLLVWFGMRTALRAKSDYSFFLALGLTIALALQATLIAGGVLDVVPLSGVVTPFLSYGRTALVTNFAIAGMLLAISREGGTGKETQPFRTSTKAIAMVLGVVAVVLVGKAAYIQTVRAGATLGAGALTLQADGFRRYQYNPRLLAIARSIPRGTIYDRNGLPLATSNWDEVLQHKDAFARIGAAVAPEAPSGETRFYPLGAKTVHLLGDLRTRANWGARNSSLAERDFAVTLQGFDDRATVVSVPDPRTGKPTYTVRYDYRELVPLLRHRWQPDNPAVKRVRDRDRNLHMSIDAALQMKASEILERQLRRLNKTKGAVVVLDPANGDVLASVSYPWPAEMPPVLASPESDDTLFDRARYGIYPPGSSFKVVTALAALRRDPASVNQQYQCIRLPDGRVGNYVKGWSRPIRDDIKDRNPHGTLAMRQGLVVSCNAYFAQLSAYRVGAQALFDTANLLGISVASPNTPKQLQHYLPQAGYGQGQVIVTPLQMARVAATVAAGGRMPYGRWVTDRNNPRQQAPQPIIAPELAATVGRFMRDAVTSGTGRTAASATVEIAGKTGTAEVENAASHAWFIGFAPAAGAGRKLAFAVLVENGQYGGTAAAPVAAELMTAAKQIGLFAKVQ